MACIICQDPKACPDPAGIAGLVGHGGCRQVVWCYSLQVQVLKPSNIWLRPHQCGSLFTLLDFVVLHYGSTPDLLSRSGTITLPTLVNPLHGGTSDGHPESASEVTWDCVIHSNSTANAELFSREHVYFVPQRCQLSLPGFTRLATSEAQKNKCSSCKTSINVFRFDFDF